MIKFIEEIRSSYANMIPVTDEKLENSDDLAEEAQGDSEMADENQVNKLEDGEELEARKAEDEKLAKSDPNSLAGRLIELLSKLVSLNSVNFNKLCQILLPNDNLVDDTFEPLEKLQILFLQEDFNFLNFLKQLVSQTYLKALNEPLYDKTCRDKLIQFIASKEYSKFNDSEVNFCFYLYEVSMNFNSLRRGRRQARPQTVEETDLEAAMAAEEENQAADMVEESEEEEDELEALAAYFTNSGRRLRGRANYAESPEKNLSRAERMKLREAAKEQAKKPSKTRGRGRGQGRRAVKQFVVSDDEEIEEVEDSEPEVIRPSRGRGRGRNASKKSVSPAPSASRRSARNTRKQMYLEESDDEDFDKMLDETLGSQENPEDEDSEDEAEDSEISNVVSDADVEEEVATESESDGEDDREDEEDMDVSSNIEASTKSRKRGRK